MKTTPTAFVPAHKQTNPEYKPGQVVNPLGMTIQSSEKTLAEYIRRKNSQAAFDVIAQERRVARKPRTECCGNPLRGCMDCPPQEKLTFEEWLNQSGWAGWCADRPPTSAAFPYAALKAAFTAGQENK